MSARLDAPGPLGRLTWGLLAFLGGLIGVPDSPFRERDRKTGAARRRLSRARAAREVRLASYLGTDLESPHISHRTPPPDRQDGDKDDRT